MNPKYTIDRANMDRRPLFLKKRFILPVVALLLIGGCSSSDSNTENDKASSSAEASRSADDLKKKDAEEAKAEREARESRAAEASASAAAESRAKEREDEEAAVNEQVKETKDILLGTGDYVSMQPSWALRFKSIEYSGNDDWHVEVAGSSAEMTDDLLLQMGNGFRNFIQQAGPEVDTIVFTDHQGLDHNVYCSLGPCRTTVF